MCYVFEYLLFCNRYLVLTEEEKEKLKGSYKVARKLEKLENLQDRHVLFETLLCIVDLFMNWKNAWKLTDSLVQGLWFANLVHSISAKMSLRSVGLQGDHIQQGFPIKMLYVFLVFSCMLYVQCS